MSKRATILCPFCSAEWSEENVQIYDFELGDQCDSGPLESPSVSISITCHACKREMYRKEGFSVSY